MALEALFSDGVVTTLASALGFVVLYVIRQFRKESAAKDEANFLKGVEVAYLFVENLKALTPTKLDDKMSLGLDALRKYLATHGQVLSPAEEARAKMMFAAKHGEAKQ